MAEVGPRSRSQVSALASEVLAGSPVTFGTVQEKYRDGLSRVVVEYEQLGTAALTVARDMCMAALQRPAVRYPRRGDARFVTWVIPCAGPSTGCIVEAARRRGVPIRRLGEGSLVLLGWGARQRRVLTAETDQTGAIAQYVAQDKHLTRALLEAVGVPVPVGRPVSDAEDAWRATEEIGVPVVVKPQYGNQGRGVATDLRTREQVEQAYAAAREESSYVMVERFVPGADYRVLVVGDRVVAASRREPAQVIGNGRSTVAELVAEANKDPRRSDGHATSLSWIKLDAISLGVLAEQGLTPESVPPAETRVLVRRNANLSTGGTATDVTDEVHPDIAARAVEAARVVGLDIAGVDVVALDIARPLAEQGAAVVEVNAGPGLRMHLDPSEGKPRPVGEAIVNLLFSPGDEGRIPVAAVTGVNGKTTTARLLAHLLRGAGKRVGLACTDGIYIEGRRTETRDCAGPHSARSLLLNPALDAAVLETARGGILREGFGFDRCAVGVVTNIGLGDHFGLRGVETLEDLARVKRVVVEAVAPTGTAVLNAEDPLVVAMAAACSGSVVYFANSQNNSVVKGHVARGGRAVAVDADTLVGFLPETVRIAQVSAIPLTHGGRAAFQVENALAATAAALALGLSIDQIRAGLASFDGGAEQAPGRFNVTVSAGVTVIIDYAHNPSAVAAMAGAASQFPAERRTLVFSGCDRRDADLRQMGELIARVFDRVILYRDWGHSGRADGELNRVLCDGIAAAGRTIDVTEVEGEFVAIDAALASTRAGDLVVLGVDSIEAAIARVEAHRAGQSVQQRAHS
ncbi:MAG: cyanophycin synthetase [Gemmataceae bacterium]